MRAVVVREATVREVAVWEVAAREVAVREVAVRVVARGKTTPTPTCFGSVKIPQPEFGAGRITLT